MCKCGMRALGMVLQVLVVAGLHNGVGTLPPMGYNTWYDLACTDEMNATSVRAVASLIASTGLLKAGYRYINLDDCFIAEGDAGRDVEGKLVVDQVRFDGEVGLRRLSKELHTQGFLFGVYTDRGTQTCMKRQAASGHEVIDAQTYAGWEIDYLKEDSCNAPGDAKSAFEEYGRMRDALNSTGRPIVFSLCGWHEWYAPPLPRLHYAGGASMGNLARIGPDNDTWERVLINADIMARVFQYAELGYYSDPCLLVSVSNKGRHMVSPLQSRAQFSLWCVLSAPLLISGSIAHMSAYTRDTYANSRAIAINQATPGVQGQRIAGGDMAKCAVKATNADFSHNDCTSVWGKRIGPDKWAVLFFNAGGAAAKVSCDAICLNKLSMTDEVLPLAAHDLWSNEQLPMIRETRVSAVSLPPHGGHQLLLLTSASATSLRIQLRAG